MLEMKMLGAMAGKGRMRSCIMKLFFLGWRSALLVTDSPFLGGCRAIRSDIPKIAIVSFLLSLPFIIPNSSSNL